MTTRGCITYFIGILLMLRCIILLFIFTAYSKIALSAVDKELAQSAKCVNFFRYYERKLKLPEDTLYSISLNESGKKHTSKNVKIVWPHAVNVEGESFYFDSQKEAVNFVKQQLREGKESIDVGCMQVNLKHHPDAFDSVEQAFSPKHNIEYAAGFLRKKYEQLGTWGKAIAHYHSATEHLGEKYKKNVVNIAQNIDKYKAAFKRDTKKDKMDRKQSTKLVYAPQISSNKPIAPERKEKRYRSNMMIYVPNKTPSRERT